MHRFYLPPERCVGNMLHLEGAAAHHALHVLRLKVGEPVTLLDGTGTELFCTINNCSRSSLSLRVTNKYSVPAPPCSITLLQAVPRGKIIENIIQKAVELGARRVVPLLTEHVVTKLGAEDAASKREKWQQVAIEAVKQCGAAWLPQIETPTTIENVLARWNAGLRPGKFPKSQSAVPEAGAPPSAFPARHSLGDGGSLQPLAFELSLVGSLQRERRHPRDCFQEFQAKHGRSPKSVGVWIGPEGDFTLDELKAIEAAGAQPISLGRLVLRVETAAIYCLSILNYELNQQG